MMARVKTLIDKWLRSEDAANRKQFRGKTAKTRFQGLRQSERNRALYVLAAGLPILAIVPFVPKWADASIIEKTMMLVTAIWAMIVAGGGTIFAIRSIYRVTKGEKTDS